MSGNMGPGRGSGRNRGLTFGSAAADKGGMGPAWNPSSAPARAARSHERGQALVEFALIAPLFLFIVVGLIQFGIGLNYWLDLNRIANQGARWAVVNKYPDCTTGPPVVCPPDIPGRTLEEHLEQQAVANGLEAGIRIYICYPDGNDDVGAVGEPVRVHAGYRMGFQALLDLASIDLRGSATMRIEQPPTVLEAQGVDACAPGFGD